MNGNKRFHNISILGLALLARKSVTNSEENDFILPLFTQCRRLFWGMVANLASGVWLHHSGDVGIP